MIAGRRVFAASALFISILGCRTTTASAPFRPLGTATAPEAWQQLVAKRLGFSGARAFGKATTATAEGRQSFRMTVEINSDGAFRVEVLSPVGAGALTVSARGREVTVRGQSRSIEELGRLIGIPLEEWSALDISMLLLGLPASVEAEVEPGAGEHLLLRSSDRRFEYEVSANGLARARGLRVEVRYDPPSFPPQRVMFRSESGETFQLQYLELLTLPR